MSKKLELVIKISYDAEKDEITDYSVVSANTKVAKETTSETDLKTVILDNSKLTIPKELLLLIEATADSRIVVQYEKLGSEIFPVIGTADAFNNTVTGNKIAKNNTVAYKGSKNDALARFGNIFEYEEYAPRVYKLLGDKPAVIEEPLAEAIKRVDLDASILEDKNFTVELMNFEL